MELLKTGSLTALRRQHLLAEFSGLKQACPDGIFMSLTPGDPALWSGVIFVRKGPYSPAILRFQMSFPDSFPRLPPLITFATDIFHPLITPLTTYTYTTDIQDNGTVSATDEERLPPGGFSLRHGFPEWFSRGRAQSRSSQVESIAQTPPRTTREKNPTASTPPPPRPASSRAPGTPSTGTASYAEAKRRGGDVSVYEVLRYLKSTFDDETVLDAIYFEAAGNPNAWKAWRSKQQLAKRKAAAVQSHRQQRSSVTSVGIISGAIGDGGDSEAGATAATEKALPPTPAPQPVPSKDPSDWNWEGVWEDRVRKGIASTLSEPVLYGGISIPDEIIRFLPLEEGQIEAAKLTVRRTLGYPA